MWQSSARCRPVTTPILAARRCISRPITVETISTHSSLNSAPAPEVRSDSMLPGSRYAMDMRKPGPVKAHSFLKLNLEECLHVNKVNFCSIQNTYSR